MQNIQSVQVINNPLKIVKVKGVINKGNEFLNVNLVPAYMDLNKGIWNLSLDTYCFKVIAPAQLETVYELSTTLCTSIEVGDTYLPASGLATLGHIYAVAPKDTFLFGHFERKWFTIDNPNSSYFRLICKPIEMIKQDDSDIVVEITMLFQRQI